MVKKHKASGIKRSHKTDIPLGVKIISILNYIGAVLCLLLSILFLLIGVFIIASPAMVQQIEDASVASSAPLPFPASYLAPIFIAFAVLMLIGAVLSFFIGRGLWKGQKWAQIVEIVFSGLAVIMGVISLISELVDMFTNPTGLTNIISNFIANLIGVAINSLVAGYLLLNIEAKRFFEK